MTDDLEALRRSYQRLMWAYPRWYRRERGTEIVTTLLDNAAPGQRRPTRVDVVDLLSAGARTRLRPPRSIVAHLVTVVVALYVAGAGAAAAVMLSGYPGPPTDAQAIAAAMAAVPVQPRNVPGPVVHCDIVCPFWDGHDDVVAFLAPPDRTDRTVVYIQLPWQDTPAAAAQARDRLITAGWDVGPLVIQADGTRYFDASKHGFEVLLTAYTYTPDAAAVSSPVSVTVVKGFTATVLIDLLAGFTGGLLAGWMTTVWLLQRFRRHTLARRSRILVAAIPFLIIAPVTVWISAGLAVIAAADGDRSALILKTPLVVVPGFWWQISAIAAVSAVLALGLAGPQSRTGETPPRPAQPGFAAPA
ncbi:MAG TPA: hypothetical protein VFR67_27545 [Pilimelia sp.]|nr:hypothetical protein [Pilimelia sp.]